MLARQLNEDSAQQGDEIHQKQFNQAKKVELLSNRKANAINILSRKEKRTSRYVATVEQQNAIKILPRKKKLKNKARKIELPRQQVNLR